MPDCVAELRAKAAAAGSARMVSTRKRRTRVGTGLNRLVLTSRADRLIFFNCANLLATRAPSGNISAVVLAPRLATLRELPTVEDEDRTLVLRILNGDLHAFRLLYSRHAAGIARILFSIGGEASEIEDAIQETFVIAHKNLPQLKEPERVRTWLTTIAVRQLRRAHRRRSFSLQMNRIWAQFSAPHSDPSQAAPFDELQAALREIPAKLRLPWVLQRVAGYSISDVAEACSASMATVKRRLAEADERIERRLQRDA